jgi:RHS repeat-associated protein
VGPPTFSPSYDADGNLLADGRWSYTWDGENRLIKMETLEWIQPTSSGSYLAGSSWQATRLEFRYDGFSRRISKKTTRLTGNTVASTAMEGYLYDRWNVIMISQLDPVTGAHLARKWSCLWKPDVASLPYARTSWQKAGGVGGLAWLQTGGTQNMSTTYHSYYGQYVLTGNAEIQVPIMDHMGNVRHYIQLKSGTVNQGYGNIGTMIGQVSANLEYDAFGREVRVSSVAVSATSTPPGLVADGLYADALPFHFSTKFTDPESGLNYYGYRFYDARDGRWISRDPIGERGGKNLYGMCYNNALSWYDVLGRDPASDFLDKVDPNRDKADDAAKRDMMDRKGCIGGAAAGCGRVTDGLSEKSTCYATQKEAETALKDLKCECGKPGRMWALRYKSNGRNPVPYGDDAPGVTYPATAGTQDQNGKPGTSAANTGQFDSRVINNGRAQGVNPTGPSQGGKIPYDDVDDSIDDWRKNTKDYDKEQWCVTCPEK